MFFIVRSIIEFFVYLFRELPRGLDFVRNSYPYGRRSERVWYEPTRSDFAQRIFLYFEGEKPPVVDLGCGKGYVLYCLNRMGFTRADGVEYNARLAATARRNMEQLGIADDVTVYNCDVVEFDRYDDYQIFFMFHPFGTKTMGRVVHLIEESLARKPRRLTVIYFYPQDHALWDKSPMFVRSKETVLSMTNPELKVYYYEFDPDWENRADRPEFKEVLHKALGGS